MARIGFQPGECELIATYVWSQNECYFCQTIHGAVSAAHLGKDFGLVDAVKQDYTRTAISGKLKTLLGIAGEVESAWASAWRGRDICVLR